MTETIPIRPVLRGSAFTVLALLLVAANLRLAITSAAALLGALTDAGALTPLTAIIVPSLPPAMFAVAGIAAALLSRRIGVDRAVLLGLVVLTVGLALRGIGTPWVIVGSTALATCGLALVNVLMPAAVREHFPTRTRLMTTVYSTVMSLGAAAAAAAAVPVAHALGSAALGLAAWAVPAFVAAAAWFFVARGTVADHAVDPELPSDARRLPAGAKRLTAFFALQALVSYVVMGWLPSMAADAGVPPERAGTLLGITLGVGIPLTLLVVPFAKTLARQRLTLSMLLSVNLAGLVGLIVAPAALPELWAALLGAGMCTFPITLALFATIGRDAHESARVSATAQSTGYLLATVGPLGAGALHQLTGSWTLPLVAVLVLVAAQLPLGLSLRSED